MWKGDFLATGESLEYATCRNGKKMNPDWSQSNVSLTCNADLDWEVSPSSAFSSCLATSYCPAVAADDGPATNQDPSIPWGGVATLTRPGVEFTGECLGVGRGDPDHYDSPKSCPDNVGIRVGDHVKEPRGTAGKGKIVLCISIFSCNLDILILITIKMLQGI